MAQWLEIPTHKDSRGSLSIIEKLLPFDIKRIYYIYDVKQTRGNHAHIKTKQAFICLGGSCELVIHTKYHQESFLLQSPNQCLILKPEEWHSLKNFSPHSTLLVLASEYYDALDYITERPYD